MLLLVEGSVEWHAEDQAHLAVPADPDCLDLIQPGKTWIGRMAYRMCHSLCSASMDTNSYPL